MKQGISIDPEIAFNTKSFDPLFSKNNWLIDSGTTSHIATQREMFIQFTPSIESITGVGEQMQLEGKGRGTIIIDMPFNGKATVITLRNIIYSPDATNCLLSTGKIDMMGGEVRHKNGKAIIISPQGLPIAEG